MTASLDPTAVAAALARLAVVDAERTARYPGDAGTRQPVHTCYVSAAHASPDLPARWGAAARAALAEHAPSAAALCAAVADNMKGTFSGLSHAEGDLHGGGAGRAADERTYARVLAKLEAEPIEDLRLDFEDGYGFPDDATEDADAVRSASALAGTASPWCGVRVKSFDSPRLRERSVRTLDVLLTALLGAGPLPEGFVVTFPKVTHVVQVEVFAEILGLLEQRFGLPDGALRFEIQVETAQSIVTADGRLALPGFLAAGGGRVTGLHFGTYDYTAACGLGAADQHLAHGACDFARHVMQLSAADTGVRLSDGSTNVLPVGDAVHDGWATHYGLVRRSLSHGFYQGWDLHPAQLVTRYAAVYGHFAHTAAADASRLRSYLDRSGGAVADEPATAQALSQSFLRAVECGALTAAEVTDLTGLSEAHLRALSRREPLP